MIKIVTDTTTGLDKKIAAKYDITVIAQQVIFGDETLRDGIDMSNESFLERLETSAVYPTTSQPPVGDFVETFQGILDAGDDVLCITVSGELSGTYNAAQTAKEQLDSDMASRITLIDSRHVAGSFAIMVLEAARMAQAGKSLEEIVAHVTSMIDKVQMDIVLNTLEYLVKGGRVSSAAGFIGKVLQMKPILTVHDGKIEARERVRTRNKAVARLRAILDDAVNGHSKIQIGVSHTGLPEEAHAMADEFCELYGLDDCLVLDIPPAVAAHTGPGALAVAYYVEN